jgi:glycerol-3-phosphate O-acyltransferase / dihydroxyacetone phosphate acyltransferase
MSKYKDCKIKVIACGLKYFHPNRFRSKMIIEYSTPYEVDPELVREYQEDKRSACSKFLSEVEKKMRSVTFSAPSYRELRAIYLARRLYLPTSEEKEFTEEDLNNLYKRFFKGYKEMRKEPEVEELMKQVYIYGAELKSLGIRDSQVYDIELSTYDFFRKTIISFVRMVMSLIFALPGLLTLAPLGIMNSLLAERERRRALARSTVKIAGVDVMGSMKIISTFVLYPLTCAFFTLLLFFIQFRYSSLTTYECIVN